MIRRALLALALLPLVVPALCVTSAASAGSGHAPDIFLLHPMNSSTVNNTTVRLSWTSVDPEGGPLGFTLVLTDGAGLNVSERLDARNRTLELGDRTDYTWRVIVSDGIDSVASPAFSFSVRVNRPPVIHSVPVLEATPGKSYRYQVVATDPDRDAPGYRLIEGPANMGMTPDGKIVWVPWTGQGGKSFRVAIAVSDGKLEERQEFTVSVSKEKPAASAEGPSPWLAVALLLLLVVEVAAISIIRRKRRGPPRTAGPIPD